MSRRAFIATMAAAALCPLLAGAAVAQAWPSQPIAVIVPYTPGASADVLMRIVGDELSKRLGQPFVVENRPGAGTTISANEAARAAPDGYTLYIAPVAFAINPKLYPDLEHDPFDDFAPVTLVARSSNVVVVPNDLGVDTLADFLALAREKPGQLLYASSGKGTSSYLNTELLKSMAEVDIIEIPYSDTSQALTDTMSGQVQMNYPSLAAALPQIRAGRVKALGISGSERSAAAPDIPTVAEAVPGYEASGWFGIFAPAGTPEEIISRLNSEINAVIEIPGVRTRLVELSLDVAGTTPAELAAQLRESADKWGALIDTLDLSE